MYQKCIKPELLEVTKTNGKDTHIIFQEVYTKELHKLSLHLYHFKDKFEFYVTRELIKVLKKDGFTVNYRPCGFMSVNKTHLEISWKPNILFRIYTKFWDTLDDLL